MQGLPIEKCNAPDQNSYRAMSRLTLSQMEAFLWIAQLGSFHKAAARLSISQPTISQRIRQLEVVMGVSLFQRQGQRTDLSDHGRELVELAREMVQLAKRIETRFTPVGDCRGVVRLGLPESVAATCLSAIIQLVAELAPLLRLDVTVDTSILINRKLAGLSLDVAVLADPEVAPPIKLVPVGHNPVSWLAAPAMAGPGEVTPADLARLHILTTPEFSLTALAMTEWFQNAGIQPARISICNSLMMIARLIRDGVGISVLPLAIVQQELASGALVRLRTNPPLRSRMLQAGYHLQGSGAPSHAVEAVVQVVCQVLSPAFPLTAGDPAEGERPA